MQFSCDSCKATLHIGDEKVKGKRLVVRCKKCGARIQIADPSLGPPPAGAAALSNSGAPALAPIRPPLVRVPVQRPALNPEAPKPAPARRAERDPVDTERTQAMDSGVLEQALAASKADDGGARARSLPPPPPPPEADPAIWFAMVAGKQTGPLSKGEFGLKITQAQITPRTYLWKEGMAGWQRALDVEEIAPLLGPPAKPVALSTQALPPPVPPSMGRQSRPGERDLPPQGFGELVTPAAPIVSNPGLSVDERRGRQRQEPDFAKRDFGLDCEDRTVVDTGLELPLELEKQDKPAPQKKPASIGRSSSAPAAPTTQSLAASMFASDDGEKARDPLAPTPFVNDEDRTHVESLPLGERVHQEAVAKELFPISGEHSPTGGSAKDLASWATQELGRRPPTVPNIPKAPVPTAPPPKSNGSQPLGEASAPTLGGAADPLADSFANVPNAPGFVPPTSVDTTGNIMMRAGVKKSRTPALLGMLLGVVVVVSALLWALARDQPLLTPDQPQAEKPSLGGTGDSVTGLAKPNAVAPDAQKPKKAIVTGAAAVPTGPVTPLADVAKPTVSETSATDAAALAALDNERGIGSHGPKADVVATPETSKGDASLSSADIKKKLGENKGALQSCIDEALRKDPNLRVGKIHVATNIAPSGIVTSVKIDKRTVDESPLGACLKRATKRIVFPSFSGDEFEVDIPILVTAGE